MALGKSCKVWEKVLRNLFGGLRARGYICEEVSLYDIPEAVFYLNIKIRLRVC
ncbi:hypothetical protein EZS27_039678 [termite gut metagenome]|uniref:Uncharacterized protein n=1 Tax=termite gut metagenome TaxID=433724 RepID=A0A5J4PGQ0_9ZZZZ